MAKETISTGKFVAFSYKVIDKADGSVLFEAKADAPDTLVYGITPGVIPGLMAALNGLAKGDKFSSELAPEAAFGQRSDENILTLEPKVFNPDGKLPAEVKVGAQLPMLTQDGYQVVGTVKSITPEAVVMDFNHPFAGRTVEIAGTVEEVRDATAEELAPSHGCGCGCNHDDCGGDCHCDHDNKEEGCCGSGCCH